MNQTTRVKALLDQLKWIKECQKNLTTQSFVLLEQVWRGRDSNNYLILYDVILNCCQFTLKFILHLKTVPSNKQQTYSTSITVIQNPSQFLDVVLCEIRIWFLAPHRFCLSKRIDRGTTEVVSQRVWTQKRSSLEMIKDGSSSNSQTAKKKCTMFLTVLFTHIPKAWTNRSVNF